MTAAELFGILTATTGLYLALGMPEGERPLQLGPVRLTTGVSTSILGVTGLLVLTAIYTQPATWWAPAPAATESGIFWIAAAASLAGAFGMICTKSPRGLMQSTVVLAAGATCLFGTAGDVLAATVCLGIIGWFGWKLQLRPAQETELGPGETETSTEPPVHPATPETARHEPLLVTVAVMLLVWLLGSGLHSATTVEARPSARSQNPRALPRPFLRDGAESEARPDATHVLYETWLTSIALGLLVLTVGIAVVPANRDDASLNDDPSDEPAQAPS